MHYLHLNKKRCCRKIPPGSTAPIPWTYHPARGISENKTWISKKAILAVVYYSMSFEMADTVEGKSAYHRLFWSFLSPSWYVHWIKCKRAHHCLSRCICDEFMMCSFLYQLYSVDVSRRTWKIQLSLWYAYLTPTVSASQKIRKHPARTSFKKF